MSFIGASRGCRRENERNDSATTRTNVKRQNFLLVFDVLSELTESQLQSYLLHIKRYLYCRAHSDMEQMGAERQDMSSSDHKNR